jgi:hypothetical protein
MRKEDPDVSPGQGVSGGAEDGSGFRLEESSAARVRGREVAWGFDTGGQYGSSTELWKQRKGRAEHRWIAYHQPVT